MKEFILTQPYNSLEEMLCSGEVGVYKEELEQGNIEKYAIVSRIGNRYDLYGNKIDDFADNPFLAKFEIPTFVEDTIIENNFIGEEESMKYLEIEKLIDAEIEKVVAEYEQTIEELKQEHAQEIATAKAEAKAELIAKLNN